MTAPEDREKITRRRWLVLQACLAGASIWTAMDAVASTAIDHPEWDMDEERTLPEWEQSS